jgi:hypothetical protein
MPYLGATLRSINSCTLAGRSVPQLPYRIQRLLQNGLITPQHRQARHQRQPPRGAVAALRARYACFPAGNLKPLRINPRSAGVPPLAKFALEAHALGDLEGRDDGALDLFSALPARWQADRGAFCLQPQSLCITTFM